MKERPILFSGPMVRAILEGRKTQTRRIVKPQPFPWKMEIHRGELFVLDGGWRPFCKIPYGCPGDRLWVRETWGLMNPRDTTDWLSDSIVGIPKSEILEDYVLEHAANWQLPHESAYWRPSIHMPRWASRITLEIESVRVERLQEITASDAIAEGIRVQKGKGMIDGEDCYMMTTNSGYMRGPLGAIQAYKDLWQSINGPGSWAANPWVWVVQFKRVEAK